MVTLVNRPQRSFHKVEFMQKNAKFTESPVSSTKLGRRRRRETLNPERLGVWGCSLRPHKTAGAQGQDSSAADLCSWQRCTLGEGPSPLGPLQPGCLTQSRSRPPTSPVKNEDQPLTPSSDESSKSVLATCLPAAQPRGGHRGEWGLGLRAEPPPLEGCETTASSRSSGREGPLGAGSDRSLPGGGGILVEFRGIYRRVSKGGNNQAPAPHTGPEPRDEGYRCEMETRCKRDHDSDGDRTASAHSVIQQT